MKKRAGTPAMIPMMTTMTAAVILLCCFLSHAAVAIETLATITYPPYLPSACFENVNQDLGSLLVGVKGSMWNNGANCGKKLRVICTAPVSPSPHACTDNFVDVTVFDYCGGCEDGGLNLSEEAFGTIADKAAGLIRVDYHWIGSDQGG